MTEPFTGGCACGAIRYSSREAPLAMAPCQCRDCQRATGTGHACNLIFSAESLKVSGTANFYEAVAGNGNRVRRGFCAVCGSPLFARALSHPNIVAVAAASLDDPGRFAPEIVVWRKSGYAWDLIDPKLTAFDTQPG